MSTERIPKTAIITGGSSGMGLGVARAYVERGGNVVLNGRNESKFLFYTKIRAMVSGLLR